METHSHVICNSKLTNSGRRILDRKGTGRQATRHDNIGVGNLALLHAESFDVDVIIWSFLRVVHDVLAH